MVPRSTCDKGKALINPTQNSSDHLFYGTTQFCNSEGGLTGAVAMRTGTIHDKCGLLWKKREAFFSDCRNWDVDRVWDVALVKACRFRTSRRMKSTVPETCAAYTSEQSVSNRSLSSKCATASTGEAAGDSSTRLLAFFTNAGVDTSVAVLIRAPFTLSSDYALLRPHLRVAEMSTSIRIMPKGKKLPHRVVALAYDGLCTFEFGIVVEMFGLPRPEFDHWYEFEVAAVDPGPIRATGG